MKKILALTLVALFVATNVSAVTTLNQSATATVISVLSIEFANTTDTTFGGNAIPWTSVDPALGNLIKATGHQATKADTAVICKYNGASAAWYLKMSIAGTLAGKVKIYMPQPINRNTGSVTSGTLAYPTPLPDTDWPVLPGTATTVYTAGNDTVNTPFGTFVAMDYGLNPTGMTTGTTYSGTITYTITTTP